MTELNLESYLSAYKGQTVDFYRFPGNYGDSLIWHGTQILLSKLDISIQNVENYSQKFNNILLIDGGGNFVDYYSDVSDFLVKNYKSYDRVIILPHTIFGDRQLNILNQIVGEVVVFCREKFSFQYVKSGLRKGQVYLWHDCAFYNTLNSDQAGNGILHAFREDKESVIQHNKLPIDNADLSSKGYATKPLNELISRLSQYEEINTDRLHLAIAGALLGKKVKLYPNSYYKNEGVYEYSLKQYTNVHFINEHNPKV